MYLLMGYLAGQWGVVDIDEHEDCAARFIERFDEFFGEDSAYVVKLPERDREKSMLQAKKLLAKLNDDADEANVAEDFSNLMQQLTVNDDSEFSNALAELIQQHNNNK